MGGMPPVLGPMDMFHWKNDVKRYACFACINYCPSRAIQIQSKFPIRSHTDVNDRYHHRFVTFKDIAGQR
jgi:formate hydrogenlyase subunit 6/NADH:ubiquinone oxidoreductase subunit I